MKYIQVSMLVNTFYSMWMNHPVSLGTMLMIQSISTSLFTILLTKNSWYAMILFITFSSGLMIMFMYMSSISSNEKFKSSIKMSLLMFMLIIIMCSTETDSMMLFKTKWMEKKMSFQENEEKKTLVKMLCTNKMHLLLTVTFLVLIVLLTVTSMINSFEGPLKKTYELNLNF